MVNELETIFSACLSLSCYLHFLTTYLFFKKMKLIFLLDIYYRVCLSRRSRASQMSYKA